MRLVPALASPRRPRAAAVVLVCAALAGAACTEVGSDPSAAVAIELDPTPLPSIVIGDSLRDSTGRAVPLAARALNSQNSVIPDAPLRFLAIDTGFVAVDSVTGHAVGRKIGEARVIASVGGLQSESVIVRVTLRPDTAFGADSVRHTMRLTLADGRADTSAALRVFVGHDTVINGRDTAVAVPNYLVRYRIVSPGGDTVSLTDTSRVVLAAVGTSRPQTQAVTGPDDGVARQVQVRLSTAVTTIPDSVVVDATVSRPDASPVPGSPIRFTIRINRGALLRSSNPPEDR